jgi:hypothetical protein
VHPGCLFLRSIGTIEPANYTTFGGTDVNASVENGHTMATS